MPQLINDRNFVFLYNPIGEQFRSQLFERNADAVLTTRFRLNTLLKWPLKNAH